MPKTSKRAPSADEIAAMAYRGENVSACFANKFTVFRPIGRVNVDLTQACCGNSMSGPPPQYQPPSGNQDIARTGAKTKRGTSQQIAAKKKIG